VRVSFLVLLALILGAALDHFGPALVHGVDQTQLEFPAPDPDPEFVKPPRPGQSYGCNPLADGNVVDDRFTHKATVWASQSASKVAVRISDDGKRLMLMRAMDVTVGY
jgi:hypothetical protein